jgi:hypothetical protein
MLDNPAFWHIKKHFIKEKRNALSTMNVHNAGSGKGYTMHSHNAVSVERYIPCTMHIYNAGD